MSVDFSRIKKYSKASNNFDEKLEHLNKELKKTGLCEVANSTGGMYSVTKQEPNPSHVAFTGLSINGQPLGFAGGNYTINAPLINGAIYSPPHPVTGERRAAGTWKGILIGFKAPVFPGQPIGSGSDRIPGSIMWVWNPNIPPNGTWMSLESNSSGQWCVWVDNAFGSMSLVPYGSVSSSLPSSLKNDLDNININNYSNPEQFGPPTNPILFQTPLGDPNHLPITIEGLSTQGFNYLKGKAGANVSSSYYSPEDKKNVINYYKKKQADPNYQPKPYERESLIRQMRAQGDDGTQIASTDPSAAFSSAPPDAFEPETVETELTPDDIPDEFKIGSNTNTTDESKPTEEGKKVKLTKWMSRTDYMSKYPNTSMVDYLSSLPYGPSDFMTPNPNYKNAWDLNTRGYENYFMNGDLSALGNRDGIPKPRHSAATPEPEKKGKTPEEIISDLEKLQKQITQSELEAYVEMNRIALELGMDFVSLIGGLFTGGATAAPVMGKLGMKLVKKYGKTVAGKMLRKLLKKFRNKKNDKMLDDIADAAERGGNESGFSKSQRDLDDLVQEPARPPVSPKPKPKPGEPGSKYDAKGRKRYIPQVDSLRGSGLYDSNKLDKEKLLSEAVKLGHFEPEALTVDIEDLRKGIMPEFPKDPPPKLIGGYSEKSRLAPVKTSSNSSAADIGKKPFIKITKKDLARNHLLTDSDIKEFMDTINKVNEYIKNHPEELIYAQERYPFHDPRLAQLNWQMDQMLNAGKEYVDKQFPENQRLFNRIQKKIKNTIDQTDPKKFKGTKLPKFDKTSLEEFKRKKEVYSRFMKKPVKIKRLFQKTKKRG